jgi:hypothetical protein
MSEFAITTIEQLNNFNDLCENVTVISIYGKILNDVHLDKIFKFKNLKFLGLLINKNMEKTLCDSLSLFQKLHKINILFYEDNDVSDEDEIFINSFEGLNEKLMCQNQNLIIEHFEYCLGFDNCNYCDFKQNFNSILVNSSVANINILNIDVHSYFLLHNLPDTVEKLQINIKDKYLYVDLNNLPYSLKELIIVHSNMNNNNINNMISKLKLPFGCNISFINECEYI